MLIALFMAVAFAPFHTVNLGTGSLNLQPTQFGVIEQPAAREYLYQLQPDNGETCYVQCAANLQK